MNEHAERCEICRFWKPRGYSDKYGKLKVPFKPITAGEYTLGRCYRYPPQIVAIGNKKKSYVVENKFPDAWNTEWCGEFKGHGHPSQLTTKPDHLNAKTLRRKQGMVEPK